MATEKIEVDSVQKTLNPTRSVCERNIYRSIVNVRGGVHVMVLVGGVRKKR